jgi:hypothetical protein
MHEEVIKEKISRAETRLDNHSKRIGDMENILSAHNVQLDNLCKTLGRLTYAIFALVIVLVTAGVGFIIYGLQQAVYYY